MAHKNIHTAKDQKLYEFYTQLADIENVLKHYKDQFRGKVVFCNCDDPKGVLTRLSGRASPP
jgi:hypothetical protein